MAAVYSLIECEVIKPGQMPFTTLVDSEQIMDIVNGLDKADLDFIKNYVENNHGKDAQVNIVSVSYFPNKEEYDKYIASKK